MTIAYLPLDSRPCNELFPCQLAAMSGVRVLAPPASMMDWFDKPSDFSQIDSFLRGAVRESDAMILSVEQLCFGSLLASRERVLSLETALCRLALVEDIKRAYPRLSITLFAVVMRTAGSNYSDGDIRRNADITAYSIACHKRDAREMERLRGVIPRKALDDYLSVRARNHAVNMACVSLLAHGVIDTLLLSQEDCQPYGLHKREQEELAAAILAKGLSKRATMHNGTDEAGCLCVAKAIARRPYNLSVRYIHALGGAFTALYEDRPFDENVSSQCAFLGIHRADAPPYDGVLCIDTPPDGVQQDCAFASPYTAPDGLRACADRLYDAVSSGVPTGFLDVRYANGGTGEALEMLSARVDPCALRAYSAWNTASNALGTALVQMVLGDDAKRNALFTLERLLDDHAYQGVVRGQVNAMLRDAGKNCLRLDDVPACEREIRARMDAYIACSPIFLSMPPFTYRCRLPWPRTFEIHIDAKT